jgi:hypothetical protein
MLKSLVIVPNEKTRELGDILQIARSLAKKKEHTDDNIPVLSILFCPVTKVYIAVYEWCSNPQGVGKEQNEK